MRPQCSCRKASMAYPVPCIPLAVNMQSTAGLSGRVAPKATSYRCTTTWTQSRHAHKARRHSRRLLRAVVQKAEALQRAGPPDAPPSYERIDSQPFNKAIMSLFRRRMVASIGTDTDAEGYDAIVNLTTSLNGMSDQPRDTQERTRLILQSLFPAWLPPAFKVMFSRPLPQLSCRLNAWVTMMTCQWLMGPCKVNDFEREDGSIARGQGVLVERCRYLEETGCASVCLNSCKVPTQDFFGKDMGLPLTMAPNYEDFSCQFSFGMAPRLQAQDDAFQTPCFLQCPSKRRHNAAQKCPGASTL